MMKIDCEVPLFISTGSMLEVYASKSPTYLEKLVKLNNKLLRLLQNKPLFHPVALLYNEFNTLLIAEQISISSSCCYLHTSYFTFPKRTLTFSKITSSQTNAFTNTTRFQAPSCIYTEQTQLIGQDA